MARLSEQFIQQVQQSTDIVDLVSQYVALTKRGKEFVGLCPFHEDHKPSMYVSPVKQIFKCFSCGAGGGAYQFVMLYDKLTFPEAVRTLAERASIPVPVDATSQPAPAGELSKSDLAKATLFAARFFREQLHAAAGEPALEYARGRGLSDESIQHFGLGCAPDGWDALLKAARQAGLGESLLVAAGLVVRREGGEGCYDRFRNRLMFPIIDQAGTVIAFGGRALDEQERAKYLNSPESPLFDKSSNLYALNWARESVVSSGQAVVVEGYLDALIPHQCGVDNVVATLGTSLTDRHVRLLSRYAKEAVLVFDADAAGAAAAERAMEIFLAQRLHVRIATIPAGKDPCDFCLAEGAEALRDLVAGAPDALQYIWARRRQAYQSAGGNLADRWRVIEEFLRVVVSCAAFGTIDRVREGQLAQHIGHMLNISPTDLQQQMRRLARQVRVPGGTGGARVGSATVAATGDLAERHVLEVLLNRPDLFDEASEKIDPNDFSAEGLRLVATVVWSLGQAGRLTLEDLLAGEGGAQWGMVVTDLQAAGERRENYEATLHGALEHLLYRRERGEMQQMKQSGYTEQTLRKLDQHLQRADVRRHPRIQ